MIIVSSCPVCGFSQLKSLFECTDYTVSHQPFQLVQCSTCNLVITSPRPADNDLGNFYQSDDYISHTSKANSLVDKLYLLARRFTLTKKQKLITAVHPAKGNLLDIGCGTGDFLQTCQQYGWNVQGVEPGEKARTLSLQKKLTVAANLEEVTGTFDFITLWHVLEHLPKLNQSLATIHSLLKPGGTLLIAVPNHESNDGKKYASYWAGYDVPRHLWHFNRKNMEQLLRNNQFAMQKTLPLMLDSFYVSLLSEAYKGKSVLNYPRAFWSGLVSNLKASKTGEYSSLIYLAKKQ
jgi:2-polyprenyl-3-methyl-5-hydroxy-6-metoxy-1,4-benzoquinol methylase